MPEQRSRKFSRVSLKHLLSSFLDTPRLDSGSGTSSLTLNNWTSWKKLWIKLLPKGPEIP
jgi:hypothetical protein